MPQRRPHGAGREAGLAASIARLGALLQLRPAHRAPAVTLPIPCQNPANPALPGRAPGGHGTARADACQTLWSGGSSALVMARGA